MMQHGPRQGQGSSRVRLTVDPGADGKQCGFVSLPLSRHESAYGRIQIPFVCVRNGAGPTVLLMAGNHGDEYEGQVALIELIQDLDPAELRGRVFILSAANLPAVESGRRVSPLDEGNLNRSFPGDPDGGPTAMLAHFIERCLLPLCDYAIDLHSGGTSLEYLPCALVRDSGAPARVRRTFAVLRAFGGHTAYVSDGGAQGAERTFHAAAERSGVIAITTELGGAASLDPEGLDLAVKGIRRVLHHAGVLATGIAPDPRPLRLFKVDGPDAFILAPDAGLFVPRVPVGATVHAGEVAAVIHPPDTPWRESLTLRFPSDGLVICRRALTLTRRGDCLFQVVSPYEAEPTSCPPSP